MSTSTQTRNDDVLGVIIGGLFLLLLRMVGVGLVTLAWLALGAFVVVSAPEWGPVYVLALVVVVGLAAWKRWPVLLAVAPFVGDWRRVADRRARRNGNRLLREMGWVPASDETQYQARLTRVRGGHLFTVNAALPGLTDPVQVENTVRSRMAVVPAADCKVTKRGTGTYVVDFYDTERPDPLASLEPLARPLAWPGTERPDGTIQEDWDRLPVAIREDGSTVTMKVRDCSGTVVGGLPGGGKTAGLTSMLATLAASSSVQFLVWDGKGGADWSWIKDRASHYNADDEDRARVADELEAVVEVMRQRVRDMPAIRGGSSIWTTGGPSEDLPLLVCVVDECQTYLDATMIPKSDKEGHEVRQRIEAAVATLVRKGRSAGVWVIPTTQKPTSDSLPTTIGANAASAISFRVKTPQAEQAIFGSAPADGDPSATDLPAMPGYAVLATEDGRRERVRFPYLPEKVAAAYAADGIHAVRPVLGVASGTSDD